MHSQINRTMFQSLSVAVLVLIGLLFNQAWSNNSCSKVVELVGKHYHYDPALIASHQRPSVIEVMAADLGLEQIANVSNWQVTSLKPNAYKPCVVVCHGSNKVFILCCLMPKENAMRFLKVT